MPDYKSLKTDSNCCNELGDKLYVQLTEIITLATENVNSNSSKIKVYPNPSSDIIVFSDHEKIKSAEIYDVNGKYIYSISKTAGKISVENLPKGMYLIKILLKDGTVQNAKFIKK